MNRHKSGSQKRREKKQKEKQEKELKTKNVIANYFKHSEAPKPNISAKSEDVSFPSTFRQEFPHTDIVSMLVYKYRILPYHTDCVLFR